MKLKNIQCCRFAILEIWNSQENGMSASKLSIAIPIGFAMFTILIK